MGPRTTDLARWTPVARPGEIGWLEREGWAELLGSFRRELGLDREPEEEGAEDDTHRE